MQLMWTFFGYSLAYPLLIGCLQITGAILLVFERTKLIAALLLTPIFLNIIFLDIVFEVNKGALVNAIVFQFVLLLIIWTKRKKVLLAIKTIWIEPFMFKNKKIQIGRFIIASILAVILFFVYQRILNIII